MVSFCIWKYYLAMKNKSKTNFAITGAAALFVGFAGTVQAVPIPTHIVQSIIQGSANDKPANPVAFDLRAPAPPKKAKAIKPVRAIVSIPEQGRMPMPSLTMPVISAPTAATSLVFKPVTPATSSAISVPDGGATGVMLGGVFGGLALLRKKLKA